MSSIWPDLTHLKNNTRVVDDFQGIYNTAWFISELNALPSSSSHNHESFYEWNSLISNSLKNSDCRGLEHGNLHKNDSPKAILHYVLKIMEFVKLTLFVAHNIQPHSVLFSLFDYYIVYNFH